FWPLGVVCGLVALLFTANLLFRDGEGRDALIAATSRLGARSVATADEAVVPLAGPLVVGVNTFLEQEVETASRRRTLLVARGAGYGAIRQQFPWAELEPDAKGVYWDARWGHSTWDKYDEIVDLANQHGLDVLARLDTSPAWARPANPWPATPPDNL